MAKIELSEDEKMRKRQMRVLEAMWTKPSVSMKDVAYQLGVCYMTLHRWMQDLDDAKERKIVDACIRAKRF